MHNNKKFNNNFIKNPVPYGIVYFKINQAVSNTIDTSNGVADVFNLHITLTNIQTGETKVLKSYNLFVSDQSHSVFAQFLYEFLEKINDDGFSSASELIGITGEVNYFQNKHGYDDLNNWNFNIPSATAQKQLLQHIANNTSLPMKKPKNPYNPFEQQSQLQTNSVQYDASDQDEFPNYMGSNAYNPTFDTDANIPENPYIPYEDDLY